MPGVADPGALVVEACHRRGIRVVPLVGPSSIILAVMASGLNGQSFAFNGYLPVKPPERAKAIRFFERRALTEGQSQLFIEAPYRNGKLMEHKPAQTLGAETRLTVAVELTVSRRADRNPARRGSGGGVRCPNCTNARRFSSSGSVALEIRPLGGLVCNLFE